MGQIEGKIAAILDATTVVINRGSQDGARKGLSFYVYTELGPFDDPDTGESLGTITQVWGKVVVSQVADRLCLARTEYRRHPAWDTAYVASLFAQPVRIRLPIDKDQVQGWLTKVRVGTSVISAQPSAPAIIVEKPEALPEPSVADSSEETESSQEEEAVDSHTNSQ